MLDSISTFLKTKYTPVQSSHLHSIYTALSNVYVEYDDSIIENYMHLLDDVEYTQDMILDTVTEILLADAVGMLNIHGIIVVDNVKLSTVDALMQLVAYTNKIDDTEDALAILESAGTVQAIAEIALSAAYPAELVDSFTLDYIVEDIERVEPFLPELLTKILTGDTSETPLTPAQVKYCAMFPDSIVVEMLQPVRLLYTGGSTDMYTKIFAGVIADGDAMQKAIILLGVLVVSNVPKTEYKTVYTELLSSHLDPTETASVAIKASAYVQEIANVTT